MPGENREPGEFINSDKVCDFIQDCPEGDDESYCGVDCMFDNDCDCGWEQSLSKVGWKIENGDSISASLPRHSTGGYFIVTQTENYSSFSKLHGPTLQNTADRCGFSFYYYITEDNFWKLQVFLETDTGYRLIHVVGSASTGSQWKKVYVTIGRVVGPFRVVFQADKLGSTEPTIGVAIDNITFSADRCRLAVNDLKHCTDGQWECGNRGCIREDQLCDYVQDCQDNSDETDCANRRRCDAETDFCNFTNSGDMDWQRLRISSDANWPAIDHTSLTPEGSIFIVSEESSDTSRAVLTGPLLAGVEQGGNECKMTLYYYIRGLNPGRLSLGFKARNTEIESTTFSSGKSDEGIWRKTAYSFTSTSDFRPLIIVEPDEGSRRSGVVAIDDIIFSEGCLDAKPEPIYGLCTFEENKCSWEDDKDSPLHWTTIQGFDAGRIMALRRDHTTQDLSGHHLYLDSTTGDEDLSARYLSQIFQPDSCELVLWYYLGGSNANKLSIYTRETIEGSLELQWREFADESDHNSLTWKSANVKLNLTNPFQIVIEASAGTFSTDSDHIGIDDMGFRIQCLVKENAELPEKRELHDRGQCEASEYSCFDDTCKAKELFCNTVPDCPDESDEASCPLQCNFDDGLCGWTNDVTVGNLWDSSDSYNHPSGLIPHRTDTGQFLYIDVKGLPSYQSAQLISPLWKLSSKTCTVSLWYFRFGSNYGTFSIKARQEGESDMDIFTLSESLNNFNKWTKVSANIPSSCNRLYQILLTAQNYNGNFQHGGYAIDDFSLECKNECPAHQCSEGGHCYSPSQKCDLTYDCCSDQSDEKDCDKYSLCSFKDDFCIWKQDEAKAWMRKTVGTKRSTHLDDISVDDGSFLEVHFEDSSKGQSSVLNSYVIQPTAGMDMCELRFSYFIQSSTNIKVYVRHTIDDELEDSIWQQSGMDSWQKAVVTLSSTEPFEVVIEASSISDEEGMVKFDSSSFTPSCDIGDEYFMPPKPGLSAGVVILIIILICGLVVGIAFAVSWSMKRKSSAKQHQDREPGDDNEVETEMVASDK